MLTDTDKEVTCFISVKKVQPYEDLLRAWSKTGAGNYSGETRTVLEV